MNCKKCGSPVSGDEIGLTLKIINRGSTEFFCYQCLAERFRTSVDGLKELVEKFRDAGCHLFVPKPKK